MNYSEMVTKVTKMASGLKKRGLKTEDCVLLMAANCVGISVSIFGVMKAGGACVCTTLNLFPGTRLNNPWLSIRTTCLTVFVGYEEEIKNRANLTRAKFIVTDETRAERALEAARQSDTVQQVFVIGQAEGCTSISELFEDDGTGPQRPIYIY